MPLVAAVLQTNQGHTAKKKGLPTLHHYTYLVFQSDQRHGTAAINLLQQLFYTYLVF